MIKFQIVFLSVVEEEALIWPLLGRGRRPISSLNIFFRTMTFEVPSRLLGV